MKGMMYVREAKNKSKSPAYVVVNDKKGIFVMNGTAHLFASGKGNTKSFRKCGKNYINLLERFEKDSGYETVFSKIFHTKNQVLKFAQERMKRWLSPPWYDGGSG